MKTTCSILILLLCISASAQNVVTTNLHNFGYINGTNNGNVFYSTNVLIPKERIVLHSGGITNVPVAGITNSITLRLQVQGSNTWITLQSYKVSTTNAVVDTIDSSFGKIALPMRVVVETTNSLQIGVYRQDIAD